MDVKIFAIYDKCVGVFSQPYFMQHKGQMIRAFSDEVNNPESQFFKHPGDFDLFCLGSYNDNSGGLSPLAQPEFISSAVEFKSK